VPTHDATVAALVARVTGRQAESRSHGAFEIVELRGFPAMDETTLVTSGLSAIRRSVYRRLPVGFELVAVTNAPGMLEDRLAAAVRDELAAAADGSGHTRVARRPPRGVMHHGLYEASAPPHLLFATSLSRIPALTGRHRVASGFVELLPAVALTDAQRDAYDASPGRLVAELARGPAG
jgi:hypothetical protein